MNVGRIGGKQREVRCYHLEEPFRIFLSPASISTNSEHCLSYCVFKTDILIGNISKN